MPEVYSFARSTSLTCIVVKYFSFFFINFKFQDREQLMIPLINTTKRSRFVNVHYFEYCHRSHLRTFIDDPIEFLLNQFQ